MGAAQNQGTVVDLDLQHPYLRNCKTRTTATETDMLATIPSQSTTYKKWKEQLQTFTASLTNSNYLLLAKGHRFDEGGVCSTSGELHLEYEYYPRLLSSEIALRKKEGRRFTEGQLWHLLYVLTLVKHTLSENGEVIGDAHPRNVFLNGTGQIKVASLRSWPGQVNNYRRAVLEQQCGYLAPEDLERLLLGAMDNQINTESQIFSIGLVLLSTASLQLQQDLYNMKEREFEQEIFYSRLGKFQHDAIYSEIFRAVISNLLEVEPLKRMNLQELYTFLDKHTENIIAKKPLRIDNVGKKLQITINTMLKAIRQQNANEKIASQNNLPPNPIPNTTTKTGMRASGEKIMNYINFEEKRPSQSNIPLPVRNQSILDVNHQRSSMINPPPPPPPLPLPNNFYSIPHFPPIPHVINAPSNEQPHRPNISKVFSSSSVVGPIINKTESIKIDSPPKYKPFETITNKSQIQQVQPNKEQEHKILLQQPSIEAVVKAQEIKANQENREGERQAATQIWLGEETSIGQLNLLMDTRQGFDHNSLITPKYEPECVEAPLESVQAQQSSHHNQQQEQVVEEVKEESEQSPLQSSGQQESKLSKKSNYQIPQQLIKESQVRQMLPQTENKPSQISNHQQLFKNSRKSSQLQKAQEQKQKECQSLRQSQNRSVTSKQSNKIQVVELQLGNDVKPLSPLVKVWGMKMNLSRNKNQTNPSQPITNAREVEDNSQKASQKSLQASETTPAAQINQAVTQNLREQRCLLQSDLAHRQSQILKKQVQTKQQNAKIENELKNDSNLLSEQKQESHHMESQNNNYILIEEDSKHLIEHESIEQIRYKQPIKEQESEIIQYHTYADIVTDGTFQECWQEILVFLRDPTFYTKQINPFKVKIRILDDRWSLKVGPGVFDILLNKEQGKFLLKNCEGSRCEGEMLGGVYKDEEKKHRIWFNSAYYYNGVKIPSREIIEECLLKCKENIGNLKK